MPCAGEGEKVSHALRIVGVRRHEKSMAKQPPAGCFLVGFRSHAAIAEYELREETIFSPTYTCQTFKEVSLEVQKARLRWYFPLVE